MSLRYIFVGREFVVFVKDSRSDTDQSLFRPWEEPIDCAAVHQTWEFSASDSQSISDRTHRQDNMQSFSDSFDKGTVDGFWGFRSFKFSIVSSSIVDNIFFLLQLPQIGDLS